MSPAIIILLELAAQARSDLMIRCERKESEPAIIDAGHVVVFEGAHADCDDALEGPEFGEPVTTVEVIEGAEELAARAPVC